MTLLKFDFFYQHSHSPSHVFYISFLLFFLVLHLLIDTCISDGLLGICIYTHPPWHPCGVLWSLLWPGIITSWWNCQTGMLLVPLYQTLPFPRCLFIKENQHVGEGSPHNKWRIPNMVHVLSLKCFLSRCKSENAKTYIAVRQSKYWRWSQTCTLQSLMRSCAWRSEMGHGAQASRSGGWRPLETDMLCGTSKAFLS